MSIPQAPAATLNSISSTTGSTALFASNNNASGRTIYNDSTALLYVNFGATASSSAFTIAMAAASYYEFPQPVFTGTVNGLWASANGSARTTEVGG